MLNKTIFIYFIFFMAGFIIILAAQGIKKSTLWLRYLSWLIIIPLVVTAGYIGSPVFNLFMIIICALALREFFTMTSLRQVNIYRWEGRIFAILIFLITLLGRMDIFYVLPVFIVMIVLSTPLLIKNTLDAVKESSVTITGILYFGWFFSHIIFLRNDYGFGAIIFLVSCVALSDIFAYTCGKLFGKKKLIPEISPNKTVIGSYAGLSGAMFGAVVFSYCLDTHILFTLFLGFLIGIFSQIGDLVVSVMKRDYNIKDSGKLIPGHGGILDRCDSLIFPTPALYYLLKIYFIFMV